MSNKKTYVYTYTTNNPKKLEEQITAAQAGDKGAMVNLCTDFRPLIMSEAHRSIFFNSLGKYAFSIASLALI